MSTGDTSPQPPTVRKDDLETKVAYGTLWGARAQIAGTVVAALAFLVAIYVAYQGQLALKNSVQTTERQSEDSQLSAAVAAIQTGNAQGASLGLVLLGENTVDRVTRQSETGESSVEVYNDYNSALQIIAGYLIHSQIANEVCPGAESSPLCFGRGWGPPSTAIDTTDAANQIKVLLSNGLESRVAALNAGQPSGINLSDDELVLQQWSYINLGWIPDMLVGTDLRGANLSFSRWNENSDLSSSYLQCTDLQGADFRGANLTDADLRGADVQGADFRGARINGAQVTSLYGVAQWPQSMRAITTLPVKQWNQAACLQNSKFWDNQSTGSTGNSTGTGSGH